MHKLSTALLLINFESNINSLPIFDKSEQPNETPHYQIPLENYHVLVIIVCWNLILSQGSHQSVNKYEQEVDSYSHFYPQTASSYHRGAPRMHVHEGETLADGDGEQSKEKYQSTCDVNERQGSSINRPDSQQVSNNRHMPQW